MNTITIDDREEDWDAYDEESEEHDQLPVRTRRKFLNGPTAVLLALLTAAGGFYAGVRVEKGQTTSTIVGGLGAGAAGGGAAAGRLSALAGRFPGAGGGAAAGGAAGGGAASSAGGSAGAGRGLGFAGFGGGNASFGTISSVDGNTLYLTESSGNTVKVTLSSATKLSKNQSVSKHAVRPGDTVVVQGLKQSNGTVVATSVSDTGAGGSAAGAGAGAGGGGGAASGGGASGLKSLFQSGGG